MERKASLFRRRCRNPFVHYIYIIGNIGSLHPLPETAYAVLPGSELERLRVLRLRGRDRRFSFKWLGMYFEFENMVSLVQSEKTRILQWQLILASLELSPRTVLDIRLLCEANSKYIMPKEVLVIYFKRQKETDKTIHIAGRQQFPESRL